MKQNSKVLTLIICTYDRNDILKLCLGSLTGQSASGDNYDVLVVNNCYKDSVRAKVKKTLVEYSNVKYIEEFKMGLSHARNAGLIAANTEWVGYIDDDCLVKENFIQKALEIIKETPFDGFGGHIKSLWRYPRPRWMSLDYGSKPILSESSIQIKRDFIWGGNMFFRKKMLEELGGFDITKGMKGSQVGYAEESLLQVRMRDRGHSIGYYPSLEVEHLIGQHKLNLSWQLKAAYVEGRDGRDVFPEQYTFRFILKEILRTPNVKMRSTISLITQNDYYLENWILDILKPICRVVGKLLS